MIHSRFLCTFVALGMLAVSVLLQGPDGGRRDGFAWKREVLPAAALLIVTYLAAKRFHRHV